jgi:hypothetical protein
MSHVLQIPTLLLDSCCEEGYLTDLVKNISRIIPFVCPIWLAHTPKININNTTIFNDVAKTTRCFPVSANGRIFKIAQNSINDQYVGVSELIIDLNAAQIVQKNIKPTIKIRFVLIGKFSVTYLHQSQQSFFPWWISLILSIRRGITVGIRGCKV